MPSPFRRGAGPNARPDAPFASPPLSGTTTSATASAADAAAPQREAHVRKIQNFWRRRGARRGRPGRAGPADAASLAEAGGAAAGAAACAQHSLVIHSRPNAGRIKFRSLPDAARSSARPESYAATAPSMDGLAAPLWAGTATTASPRPSEGGGDSSALSPRRARVTLQVADSPAPMTGEATTTSPGDQPVSGATRTGSPIATEEEAGAAHPARLRDDVELGPSC